MARKPGLGKGLDALIPGVSGPTQPADAGVNHIREIAIEKIIPNPHQPRSEINAEELQELAESIREHGIIQPLILRNADSPDNFILIAGERRLRAAQLAGLSAVPAMLREASEQEQLELALIENVQREDLSPLETAEAFYHLAEYFDLSHDEIAKRVGKSRVSITNTMRLLKLPDVVKNALAGNEISEGHARALLALNTPQAQIAVLETITRLNYSVRQTEELVRKYSGERKKRGISQSVPPEITALEAKFRERLGMRVNIHHRGNKGKLVIHYYSDEELNNLIDQLFQE